MRVIGHCSAHPSREARLRCRHCRLWLCERCVQIHSGHIYCGRACWFKDTADRALRLLGTLARRPITPLWAWSTVGCLLAVFFAVMSSLSATLRIENSLPSEPGNAEQSTRQVDGVLHRVDGDLRLDLRGEAHSRWLVVADDGRSQEIELDAQGEARVGVGSQKSETLRVIPLDGAVLTLEARALDPATRSTPATSTANPTVAATPTPQPTLTNPPPAVARKKTRLNPPPQPRGASRSTTAPPILHLIPDAGPRIALTFDGGISSNGTVDFLDFMTERDLHVTLFLTGQFIEREPGLVRRAVLAGHEVGNHTFSHPHLTSYGSDRRQRTLPEINEQLFKDELRRTEEAFFRATGRRMAPLWRSPFGEENSELRSWAMDLGYLHVRWSSLRGASLDSRDWVDDEHSPMYQEPRRMMERLMRFPHLEGGIVLMHLSSDRIEPPWNQLPIFLEALRNQGIEAVQVSELLQASRTWRPWLERARTRHQQVWGMDSEP